MNAAALFNLPVGGSVGTTLRAHLIVYLAQLVVVRLLTSSLCTLVPASNIPDSGSPGAIAHHGELLLGRAAGKRIAWRALARAPGAAVRSSPQESCCHMYGHAGAPRHSPATHGGS